ncbi:glyoxalase [Polaribacter aquimarinus]|uniref:Glyoxalase n=1 Tax=Polaribacter aquimarinus TaxID=2100726 RepID=A0A2U2JA02_9FLAO|nr:glyoxalase [Polaribacter aquimarinus]PWG05176.1 glyoxalase [Polaribacter aquimarinus]
MNKKERPILSNLVNTGTSDNEKFQNEVIRPIIKMQHDILVELFHNYLVNKKINLKNYSKEKQKETINAILTKDNHFKNVLLGSVIGHFSLDELSFYHQNPVEFKRRINQIINLRIQDYIS